MKILFVFILLLTAFFGSPKSFALNIDEKLTLRFLKVSNSKKTVLVNRGAEDGLIVGDHAKFFITEGVIARGLVEKVSPSRSIWSLYRVVDPAEITDDKVLNLKIATPVKITEDPTKSMKEEPIPSGSDNMGMSDATPLENPSINSTDADKKELSDLGLEEKDKVVLENKTPALNKIKSKDKLVKEALIENESTDSTRNWEIWGTMFLNSLSGNTSSSTGTTSSTVSSSLIDFSIGIDRYFLSSQSFLQDLSLTFFVHKNISEFGSSDKSKTDNFEYGIGTSYYFINHPSMFNHFLGYAELNLGLGSIKVDNTVTNGGEATVTTTEGSNKFVLVGVGTKYVMANGFGLRALIDYYKTTQTYNYPDNRIDTTTLSGPMIKFGISYRF